ncbi:predicted protein, partial [Postia placenta Mad-698-R]
VLVTGINGHLASATAFRLLESGYRVRGTVRALTRAQHIQRVFSNYGSRLQVVEVPDVAAPNAYASAMKGVLAVINVASPVNMDAKSPEEHYVPAVDGALNVLRSAQAEPSVQHVCMMGSIVSVIMTAKDATKEVITTDDWNVISDELAYKLDPSDPSRGFHIYTGSKIRAEKAAWEFMKTEKPRFTLSTVLPAPAYGPVHNAVYGPPRPDVSLGRLYDYLAADAHANLTVPFVHVYDVADLCVRSITDVDAHGQRLIAFGGRVSLAQIADILRKAYPERPVPPNRADAPCLAFPDNEVIRWDTSVPTKVLGGKWRSLEDAV